MIKRIDDAQVQALLLQDRSLFDMELNKCVNAVRTACGAKSVHRIESVCGHRFGQRGSLKITGLKQGFWRQAATYGTGTEYATKAALFIGKGY